MPKTLYYSRERYSASNYGTEPNGISAGEYQVLYPVMIMRRNDIYIIDRDRVTCSLSLGFGAKITVYYCQLQ